MPALTTFGFGSATMKMNTAVAFSLGGVALTLIATRPASRTRILLARLCAALVTAVGTMTLAEYLTGLDLHIDQLLITETQPAAGDPPGRMAPNTALCFALSGFALLLIDSAHRAARAAAQAASLAVLFLGFLAVSGYLLSVDALYGVAGYTSMALPTAVAVTLLAGGVLASRPDRGVVAILAQANLAGAALRRFLPLLVAVPLLLAWLQHMGFESGLFGAEFGAALTATLGVCLLTAVAFRSARVQGALEFERTRANEQIELAMEGAPNGMVIVDATGTIVLANAEVERLFGYSRAELVGGPIERIVPPSLREEHERLRASYQEQPVPRTMAPTARTLHGFHKDGSVVPVEVGLNPMNTPEGHFVLGTIVDVRNREQRDRAAERERFFQLSNDALCIANTAGYFVQVNPAFERILGYTREEMLAAPYAAFIHPDDAQATAREASRAHAGESILDFRNRYRGKDGVYRWLQWRAMPDPAGLLYATARDITHELQATNALRASLEERGVLLQEVHHRVKNNLQIIASMINMQVRRLDAGVARSALEDFGSRVQAIGLIHERLYQSADCARIAFREYVETLVDNIFQVSARNPGDVAHEVVIAPLSLTVEKAIPCGLIINELVTNALKHAFPGNRRGSVRVSLREPSPGRLTLCVADDGVGLAGDFQIETASSVGLTLVTALTDQLKGQLTITRAPGATFEITFPVDATS